MLLLVNYRPEYQHRWAAKSYYTQLRIDPLAPESAEALLRCAAGQRADAAPLRQVLDRAHRRQPAVSRGERAHPGGDRCAGRRARRLSGERASRAIEVPATVHAILAARIDRLAARRQAAAADRIGHRQGCALRSAAGDSPTAGDELRTALDDLQAAEFVYEISLYPDLEYTFKHALTHDVAYGSLLQERRRALHVPDSSRRSSGYMPIDCPSRWSGSPTTPCGARYGTRLLDYLRRAGLKAFNRSANREAATHLELAIGALLHLPQTRDNLEQAVDLRLVLRLWLVAVGGTGAHPRARSGG